MVDKNVSTYSFIGPGGVFQRLWGGALASAAELNPTHMAHHVTGTQEIVTIEFTDYDDDFFGPLFLVADGAWKWNVGGNIAAALDGVMVVGTAAMFIRDRATNIWHPFIGIKPGVV